MYKFRKGDIVGRKSYNKDILFAIEKIIKTKNGSFAILKGMSIRIEADAPLDDLELIEKNIIDNNLRSLETRLKKRIDDCFLNNSSFNKFNNKRLKEVIYTGKILHLDGDKKYSEKSARYYKQVGLNAIVRNISENRQPLVVKNLLNRYNPDILIITGHDGMIKNGTGFNDIYNYRNSRHFINAVKVARESYSSNNELVIFAGACQSYYEAIMIAGANFASSPERVLIDFLDPLIIAEKVATTDKYKYLTINDIAPELRDGTKGIGGIGAKGKKNIIFV